MEFLTITNIDKVGTLAVLCIVALAIITDKLVWHTRLKKETARADRWEGIALNALAIGAHAGVTAAEVAIGVVSSIPDPQGDRDRAARSAEAGN